LQILSVREGRKSVYPVSQKKQGKAIGFLLFAAFNKETDV